MRPLNLASQPFRNETLPAVLFGIASVILLAVTVRHSFVVRGLLPARTSKLHQEVASLEAEAERLRTEARSLKAPRPDARVIAEWNVLKDLVDQRTFSWTGLFARLEDVLPREVRLVSIAPEVKQGRVGLDITAVARPPQAGLGLVGLLEARPEFEDVYPVSISEQAGGTAEFTYTMRYLPGAAVVLPAADVKADTPAADLKPEPTAAPAAPRPAMASPAVPSEQSAPGGVKESAPPARMRPVPLRPAPLGEKEKKQQQEEEQEPEQEDEAPPPESDAPTEMSR